MQYQDISPNKQSLHFVEADAQIRAELARTGMEAGFHCEIYENFAELMTHPPRSGIIICRDNAEFGRVADIIDRLYSIGIWLPVLAMDFAPTPTRVVEAVKAGALDYLTMPLEPRRLASSVARISGEANRTSADRQHQLELQSRLAKLSTREREVLDALSKGGSNKYIARQLNISPRTVEIHRANMMTKLGARTAAEAIRVRLEVEVPKIPSLAA